MIKTSIYLNCPSPLHKIVKCDRTVHNTAGYLTGMETFGRNQVPFSMIFEDGDFLTKEKNQTWIENNRLDSNTFLQSLYAYIVLFRTDRALLPNLTF